LVYSEDKTHRSARLRCQMPVRCLRMPSRYPDSASKLAQGVTQIRQIQAVGEQRVSAPEGQFLPCLHPKIVALADEEKRRPDLPVRRFPSNTLPVK
jgi:hypothetical protein